MADVTGSLAVDGQPSKGAEVSLLDAAGKVVAAAPVDEKGAYTLPIPAGFSTGWVLARVYEPILGARAQAVPGPQKVDFDITSSDAFAVAGEINVPEGVKPDWMDVTLTPRALVGVPPEARLALLTVDTGPSIRGTFAGQRVQKLAFEFRVLPGTWDLRVNRLVEAPFGARLPVPNLTATSVALSDDPPAKEYFGGFLIEVDHDRRAVVTTALAPADY